MFIPPELFVIISDYLHLRDFIYLYNSTKYIFYYFNNLKIKKGRIEQFRSTIKIWKKENNNINSRIIFKEKNIINEYQNKIKQLECDKKKFENYPKKKIHIDTIENKKITSFDYLFETNIKIDKTPINKTPINKPKYITPSIISINNDLYSKYEDLITYRKSELIWNGQNNYILAPFFDNNINIVINNIKHKAYDPYNILQSNTI